ncbi:MAG: PorT family protein [Chryseobacterium sp.]|nr:MAG: PorT family protein [Chryseobacterium sp.]
MIKKLVILLFFSMTVFTAKAQNWGGGVDESDIHFGFTFQYISSEYKILKKRDWMSERLDLSDPSNNVPVTDRLNAISSKVSPGFGIGFVVNKRINEHIDLRFTPSLVFNDRLLEYEYATPSIYNTAFSMKEQKVQSTMVDFPFNIKVKSDRRNNFRAYLIAGAKYSMDIASKKKTSNAGVPAIERLISNKKNFLSYEAGIGFDLYFEYFKMSPELKWSQSMSNILVSDAQNPYSAPLDKLMLRHVTFSLYFE